MTPQSRFLVAYATKHGSTREVAEGVAETLRRRAREVDVRDAAEIGTLDGYDAVVVGGALYIGRLHKDALSFLERHRRALATLPLAVFAIGPKTAGPDDIAGARAQLDRALAKLPDLSPAAVAIFGGVVDPTKLRFPFNRVPASDARDWDAINEWAEGVAALGRRLEIVAP